MITHVNRVLRIKGHKLFLSPYEHENVSGLVTKARVKRLMKGHKFIYSIRSIKTDFITNQTVIRWQKWH